MIAESLSLYQSMAERETDGEGFSPGVGRAFLRLGDGTTTILVRNACQKWGTLESARDELPNGINLLWPGDPYCRLI